MGIHVINIIVTILLYNPRALYKGGLAGLKILKVDIINDLAVVLSVCIVRSVYLMILKV